MPSQGEVLVDSQNGNEVTALLHDFDIAKHQLKPRHIDWLRKNVVGLLRRGGSIGITGMASPSGTDAFNLALSRRRIDEVLQFLRQESGKNFRVMIDLAMGEQLARAFKVANGTEDGFWRGAVLTVRLTPPPRLRLRLRSRGRNPQNKSNDLCTDTSTNPRGATRTGHNQMRFRTVSRRLENSLPDLKIDGRTKLESSPPATLS